MQGDYLYDRTVVEKKDKKTALHLILLCPSLLEMKFRIKFFL